MSPQFTNLPQETQSQIFSYLRHSDLAKVLRVCKSLRSIAEPLIWTYLEFHDPLWHECDRHNNPDQPRWYLEPSPEIRSQYGKHLFRNGFLADRARGFLVGFPIIQASTLRHVKSLCMTITPLTRDDESVNDVWKVFSKLSNLQALDLTVEWPYGGPEPWEACDRSFCQSESLPPLTKLQELRLQGYVPRTFARWLLLNSTELSTLTLFILDRPVSGAIANERINPPPRRKRGQSPNEDDDEDDDEASDSDSNSDSGSDYDEEGIAPRALSILDPSDTLENLRGLSSLLLSRPAQSGDDSPVRDAYISIRCDRSILEEWNRLILAARPTLKHLVLDQRLVCEEIEQDGTDSDEYMEAYPYGPGFERFTEIVLPVLNEENAVWPMLENINLYGFDVPEPEKTEDHPGVLGWPSEGFKKENSLLHRIKKRFEPLGVEVKSDLGTRMTFEEENGVVSCGDGLGPGWRPDDLSESQ